MLEKAIEEIHNDLREIRADIKQLIEHKGITVGEAKTKAIVTSTIVSILMSAVGYLFTRILR